MATGRSTVRALAWAALAGQAVFIAAWIVAGALEPHYSHLREGVSALGAKDAAHPWIVNAGIVVLGLSIVALGVAVVRVLPKRRGAVVAALLFGAAGAAIVLSGVFRIDCSFASQSCEDLWRAGRLSSDTDVHLWASLVAQLLFALTPFAIARALWPSPVAAASLAAGAFGLVFGVAAFFLGGSDAAGGLVQRTGLLVFHLWVLIVAVGILHATRGEPRPGPLVPLRPRDFFAAQWTGEGQIVLRPFFLGRLFSQRVTARRKSVWLSESLFRFEDEAGFGDGRSQRRMTYCEFVADDRVRLTAGDMPDGAHVLLEDEGYRVVPFRLAFPLGPLPVLLRLHDISHVEDDGTLVNEFDVRTVGVPIPVARVAFRVRPVDASEPAGQPERHG
jgi:hypothetical protein